MKKIMLAIAAIAATLPLIAMAAKRPREITLVAKQMAFYVEGDSSPNPVIRLKPGERVRFTLRNEDRGVEHDFTIRALGVATGTLRTAERGSVVFEVPKRIGEYRYTCKPHAKMMAGTVTVE